jgi:hypothetical protein
MRRILLAGLALLGLGAVPARLVGQAPSAGLIAPGHDALAAAAELRMAPSQPSKSVQLTGATITTRRRGGQRQGEILMLVGAAGIVTGLLVDEDLITIAGAGVGCFGLYLYLQETR